MATAGNAYFLFPLYTSLGPTQVVPGAFALGPPPPPPRRGYVAFITGSFNPGGGGTGVQGPWILTNPTSNPLSIP